MSLSINKKKVSVVFSLATMWFSSASALIYDANGFYFDGGVSVNRFHIARKAKGIKVDDSKYLRDDNTGVNFILGKRFADFGVELGYVAMNSNKYQRHAYLTDVRLSEIGLYETLNHENANVYFNLTKYFHVVDNLELKASAGVGMLQTKTKYNIFDNLRKKVLPEIKNSEAEIKPRIGAGLMYNVTKTWGANLDLSYQLGNQYYRNVRSTGFNVTYRL